MLENELEYLKPLVSHYWCSAWWCRVDRQSIVGNRDVLWVVAPDGDVETARRFVLPFCLAALRLH